MSNRVYWSAPVSICYDGEETPPEGGGGEKTLTFTQAQLNTLMAEHKRNLQAELQQTKSSLTETETQLQELLQRKDMDSETSKGLRETLTNVQKQLRTKEQQAELDKQKLNEEWRLKYDDEKKRADDATTSLQNNQIERAWIDSVGTDYHNLQVFLDVVKPKTAIIEGKVMVDLPDMDVEGKPTVSQFTPAEAVSRMKELPDMYGGLFKSNLVHGIGGSNATGGVNSGGKIPKIEDMDFATFKKLVKENPSALGV